MNRFLALGDSYTIGQNVPAADRWPVQLVTRLRAQGVTVTDPEIIAVTGWTTDELAAGITYANPQGPYHLVSLLIGVNNQYRGRALTEYRQQFTDLLAQAIGFGGGEPSRVMVLSIPDWGMTPFAAGHDAAQIASDIDAFNAINREETAKMEAHYVDITPLSRQAAHDPTLIADDGLHPSGKMYAAWVETVLPLAAEILQKGSKAPDVETG